VLVVAMSIAGLTTSISLLAASSVRCSTGDIQCSIARRRNGSASTAYRSAEFVR
jgi:hypothetical protein